MDQAANSRTLDWYSPELLTEFLEELRDAGYNIGLSQYIAAHDLVLALFAKNILSRPEQLESYLGPLVCSSASEQDDFKERFLRWIQLVHSKHTTAAKKPTQSDEALDSELEKIRKRSRRLTIALFSFIILFPPLLWAGFRFFPKDTPVEELPTTVDSPPVSPAPPVQETPEPFETESDPTREELVTPPPLTLEATTDNNPLGWESLALLFLLVPGVAFAIWRAWWLFRARLFLQRRSSDQTPELAQISFQGKGDLVNSQVLLKTSQQLRRRVRISANTLDVSKTVRESVQQGGWFTPIYGYRQLFPEYLFLIDRVGIWDHQAEFAKTLINRFEQNGVYSEVFFFDADPRVCSSEKRDKSPQALQELSAKYQHHRLVAFTDAEVLTDAQTAQLTDWSANLLRWKNPVIITPKPLENWSREEFWVAQSFILLPMTETGLQVLGQVMQEGSAIYPALEADSAAMPIMLRMRPKRWLERNPPTSGQARELIVNLRSYLGDEGFYWLAACAVFPEIRWNITLYLGNVLKTREGYPLVESCSLTNLARLPWYRHGYMPDWFRAYLIASLNVKQKKEIRTAFQELLVTAVSGIVGPIQLEIAKRYQGFLPQLARPLLRLLARKSSEKSALKDYIFLDFMSQASKLSVEIPDEVAPVLQEYSQSNIFNRRQFSVSLVSLIIVGSLAYVGWSSYWGRQIQATEQVRRALEEARELQEEGNSLDALVQATWAGQLVRNPNLNLEDMEGESKILLHDLLSETREVNRLEGHTAAIQDISVSPNGDLFATLDTNGNLKVWDLNGKLISEFSSEGNITAVDFGPNGEIALANSDQFIKIFDRYLSIELLQIEQNSPVQILKFSPNGTSLATIETDASAVRILSTTNSEEIAVLNHADPVTSAIFSPNGDQLLVATQAEDLLLWNVNSGSVIREFNLGAEITAIAFSPSENFLGIADGNGDVILQSINEGAELGHFAHGSVINDLTFAENELDVATAGEDRVVRVWSLEIIGEQLEEYQHEETVNALEFATQNNLLISGDNDNTVRMWKTSFLHTLPEVSDVAFSPDGRIIASVGLDGSVQLQNLEGSEIIVLEGHNASIYKASFSPDGRALATSSDDGTVKLWDLATGNEIRTLSGHSDIVLDVSFSPDGRTLATSSNDGTVKLWDLATGNEIRTLSGHDASVNSVAYSPDGRTLATASADGTVRVWNLEGQELAQLTHDAPVNSVAYSPDGRTLATASADSTVRVWNLEGQELTRLTHDAPVNSVAYSPDGRTLATAGRDGKIIAFQLKNSSESIQLTHSSLSQLIALSCFRTKDYLTNHPQVTEQTRKMCGVANVNTLLGIGNDFEGKEAITNFVIGCRRQSQFTWLPNFVAEQLFGKCRSLAGVSLQGVDLSNADLRDVNLSNADLSDVNLSNANLSNADLSDVNLSNANLSNANLSNANLSNVNLIAANLSNVNLIAANLSNANLNFTVLSAANLSNANLSNAILSNAILNDINLSASNLDNADLSTALLITIDLRKWDDLTSERLTREIQPYLCGVALPANISNIDPNRDCDVLPQILTSRYGYTVEEAQQVIEKARNKQWSGNALDLLF